MKRCLIGLTIAMLLLPIGCSEMHKKKNAAQGKQEWDQVRARIKMQLAQRAYESGNLDDAMKTCGEALGLDTQNYDGFMLMARILLAKGQNVRADAALDQAESLQESAAEIAYLRGVIAERQGEPAGAVDFYRQAYQAAPDQVSYLLTLAETLIAARQLEEAWSLLESRQGDFEREPTVYLLMGQALNLLGRQDEAVDAFVMAVQLAPDNALLREEAALAALAAGRSALAMEIIQPMLVAERWQASRSLVLEMGNSLLRQRRPRLAVALLKPALERDGRDAELWLLAARAYYEMSDTAAAGDAIRQAMRADDSLTEARLMMAYHHLVTGQKENAAELASAILAAEPHDAEAELILAEATR